jgi:hypothetical protein
MLSLMQVHGSRSPPSGILDDPTNESTNGSLFWFAAGWNNVPSGTAAAPSGIAYAEYCGRRMMCATPVVPGNGSIGAHAEVSWLVPAPQGQGNGTCYMAVVSIPLYRLAPPAPAVHGAVSGPGEEGVLTPPVKRRQGAPYL